MKHLKLYEEYEYYKQTYGEIIKDKFFDTFPRNKKLIERVENCETSQEFVDLINEIYPKTKSGLDGYEGNFINMFLDGEYFELKKKIFINHLKESKLSDIIIYGPKEGKNGRNWIFSTHYLMFH